MNLVQSKSSRVDKRSASTLPAQKGGCAALIHPTFFAENKFTLSDTPWRGGCGESFRTRASGLSVSPLRGRGLGQKCRYSQYFSYSILPMCQNRLGLRISTWGNGSA